MELVRKKISSSLFQRMFLAVTSLSQLVSSPFVVTVLLEISATCSCFYDLSRWGEFACRLHQYECTQVFFFFWFIIVVLFFFFYFYNILYCVILHWYKEPFLVEFCKVYGIANTSKYIAPDAFCHVLTFSYFFILAVTRLNFFVLTCQTFSMSVCKMLYFVVLFLFLHMLVLKLI